MSAVAQPAPLAGPKDGGIAARRAVIRWAGRMFRREWRQQLLVLTLLTVAVAAAIGSITIAHNIEPADDYRFGSADTALTFDGSDPQKLQAALTAARSFFGTVDVISHRSIVVPGSVDKVDYRAQEPGGAYAGELLALRQGSYPTGPGEVAVTDGVADLLRLDIGSTLALDGHQRRVVGIVENPRKLSDEFALVSPSSAFAADSVSVLVTSSEAQLDSFFERGLDSPTFASSERKGDDHPEAEPLLMVSVVTVFLLLASLVAAAGFAVIAHRRLRQLGMLAAVGATEKQLRLALLANGAVVGTIAAVVGTTVGLAAWFVFAPTLESALDHRIDRLSLPWWFIAATVLLAVLGATVAAWWPGRAAARLPVVSALSGRPPKPRPARHSALAAAALIALGVGCLALSDRQSPLLIIGGLLLTIFGALLLGPLAIRVFSGIAGRLSITPRLALRDLARYQARSGAALAAVTLSLGIAATVVAIASAEAAETASEPPTLSDRQIRVYLGSGDGRGLTPVDATAQVPRLAASVRQLANRLDNATVMPLLSPTQPGAPPLVFDDTQFYSPLDVLQSVGKRRFELAGKLYVATPAVLRYLGIDPATIDRGTDFLVDHSVQVNGLFTPGARTPGAGEPRELPLTNVQRIEVGQHLFGFESARKPPIFITPEGLRRHGWKQIPAGWLVESSRPLTSDQIADARELAADAGLTIEVERDDDASDSLMAIATGAGAVLALCILALTVGLIRSESAGDLRTLTATGAGSRIRRTLTGVTAGALALLGAILGVAGAYVAMLALYHDDLGYLSDVPLLYLALALVGVPLAAAAAGWLVAGREPSTIARPVLD